MNAIEGRTTAGELPFWLCAACGADFRTKAEAEACHSYDGSDLAAASLPTILDATGKAWRVGLGMRVAWDGDDDYVVESIDRFGCNTVKLNYGKGGVWANPREITAVLVDGRPVYEGSKK